MHEVSCTVGIIHSARTGGEVFDTAGTCGA